jgi:predicted ATPase/signal transduction histidine kinase
MKKELFHRGNHFAIYLLQEAGEAKWVQKIAVEDFPPLHVSRQLENELSLLHGLALEGIRPVEAMETVEGKPALRMPWIEGTSLKQLIKDQRLSLETFFQLSASLLKAVSNMHSAGLMHKDLTPNNIICSPENDQVTIIDFGLSARINPKKAKTDIHIEGTLGYMAPEQTGRTNQNLDYRCDIYALGIGMYEMLTGHLPFEVNDSLEAVHAHLARQASFSEEENERIPDILQRIVLRCMNKRAEDRYQSADGLLSDLLRCKDAWESQGVIPNFQLGEHDISPIFRVPDALYGRAQEQELLLNALEQSCQGTFRLVTVSGDSGTGKSALVASLSLPVSQRRGFFGRGKYEQYQLKTPFFAIGNALGAIVRNLLKGPQGHLHWWKRSLQESLGTEAAALFPLVPELELLMGPQPELPPISLAERQKRIQSLLNQLVRTLAKDNHPLVLFIDDIQWSDSASRQWLEQAPEALTEAHLLIVLVYREKETAELPLVSGFLERLRQSPGVLPNISIGPLRKKDIAHMLADTFRTSREEVRGLAIRIHAKTHGNAFFVHQFLISLYENSLVRFDFEQKGWLWKLEEIDSQEVTDNVVSFLSEKLIRLSPDIIKILTLGSCLGTRFDTAELSLVAKRDVGEIFQQLQAVEALGYVTISDAKGDEHDERQQCTFIHDKLHQAVYSLMDEDQRMLNYLQIARALSSGLEEERREDRIFGIANSFLAAEPLIEDKAERLNASRVCRMAGEKALEAASSGMAHRYLKQGISFLPEGSWESHYDLSFSLVQAAGQAAYGEADLEAVRHYATLIRAHARDNLDRCAAYRLEIDAYDAEQKMFEAIDTAIDALQSLGVKIPRRPSRLQVAGYLFKSLWVLRGMNAQDLVSLPEMTDPKHLAIVDIVSSVKSTAYRASPELFAYMVILGVLTSVRYGNAPASGFDYGNYGVILLAAFNQRERAISFGEAGMEVALGFPSKKFVSKTIASFSTPLLIWKSHIKEVVELLREGIQVGQETGDLSFMATNGSSLVRHRLLSGVPLADVLESARHMLNACIKARQDYPRREIQGNMYNIGGLIGMEATARAQFLNGQSEEQYLELLKNSGDMLPLYFFHVQKTVRCFFEGNYSLARKQFAAAKPYREPGSVLYENPVMTFFSSMAQLLDETGKRFSDRRIKKNIKLFKRWEKGCPDNYIHKRYLLEGEYARRKGKLGEALEAYSNAIQQARNYGFIHIEALAWERAGMLQRALDNQSLASGSLRNAAALYRRWGCTVRLEWLKVTVPEQDWSDRLDSDASSFHSFSVASTSTFGQLDVSTVIKAAQTLSGEVVREKLFSRMVEILAENAGAQRALLLLPHPDKVWTIAAQTQLKKKRRWPETIVNYVSHTRETVVLDHAAESGEYEDDPYIAQYAPQSVLCMPVLRHDELQGIVYLENNLMRGAFDKGRLEMLRILSAQLAISFENATLYENLETRVKDRTAEVVRQKEEIEKTLSQLQKAQIQLVESEKMASLGQLTAGIAHEINNPVNFIMAGIRTMRRNMEELSELWEAYSQLDMDNAANLLPEIIEKRDDYEVEENVEEIFELAESIERGAVRTAEIVRGLRLFSRLDEGDFKRIDLHETLDASLLMLRNQYRNRIEIVKQYGNIPAVECLPGKLNQVFMNLLANAIQAIEERGTITISTTKLLEDHIEVSISDTGSGISEEQQKRIFDPFYTTKDVGQGTGLGLSITHGIIEQHQGTIRLESKPDHGSTFFIHLPIKQERDE